MSRPPDMAVVAFDGALGLFRETGPRGDWVRFFRARIRACKVGFLRVKDPPDGNDEQPGEPGCAKPLKTAIGFVRSDRDRRCDGGSLGFFRANVLGGVAFVGTRAEFVRSIGFLRVTESVSVTTRWFPFDPLPSRWLRSGKPTRAAGASEASAPTNRLHHHNIV